MLVKEEKRIRRHRRVRAKVKGTSEVPRLCVFRSNRHIYAQLINDEKSETIITASDFDLTPTLLAKLQPLAADKKEEKEEEKKRKDKKKEKGKKEKSKGEKTSMTKKVSLAFAVGRLIAQKAIKKKIKKVVFDRGGYKYHGRVKAVAEGMRVGGLKF